MLGKNFEKPINITIKRAKKKKYIITFQLTFNGNNFIFKTVDYQ